jgi:hypothetical protein
LGRLFALPVRAYGEHWAGGTAHHLFSDTAHQQALQASPSPAEALALRLAMGEARFHSGDFAGGISAGVNQMIGLINGEKLPEPEPPHWDSRQSINFDNLNPFWLFFAFVVSSMLRSALGRLLGSVAAGGFVTVLAWFLIGSFGVALAAGVLAFIFSWNEFSIALNLTSRDTATVPVAIARFAQQYETQHGQMAAAAVIATIPALLLMALGQRFIVRGLTMGSVK